MEEQERIEKKTQKTKNTMARQTDTNQHKKLE